MSETPPTPPERPSPNWGDVLHSVVQALGRLARFVAGDDESPLADLQAAFGNLKPHRILLMLAILAVLGYLLTGIYVVAPGEAAVVRRFGAVVEPNVAPGLHYRLPWPIDRVDIVNVSEVRREVVGVLAPEEDHVHPEPPSKLQVLSGDTNVIDVEIIVQYQVGDPAAYLVNVEFAPYRLVRDIARQAVTIVMSQLPVDAILTTERQTLQNTIRAETQRRLDAYQSGLIVVGINLQKAFPPDEVANAFVDVSSARVDRERTINDANGYANSLLPQTRGEAQQILANAAAYRSDIIAQANGEAQAFETILAEYQTNSAIYGKDITHYRLFLETLESILPRAQIYVVNIQNGETVNLRLLGSVSPSETPVP
ncbi:MAG: FtsH protease activity modulator HflK [Anaerolineae bacterium]|nr:FtsH protease activity modulator HflK [Anaerolineae bacterium]